MRSRIPLNRRQFLNLAMAAAVFEPGLARAAKPTGFYVLDNAAIAVRNPTEVLFEAVALAGTRVVTVGEQGVIIYSDDNGKTWLQASVPVVVTLNCVAFATPMLGWAAGHFGVILNTVDGGKSWQTQLNGIQATQLTMAAAQAASAAANSNPVSAHAMRRASIFVQDGPNKPFLSMVVFDAQKVIVFGSFRMAMLTLDGGKTWQDWSLHIDDPVSHNLYGAAKIGSDILLAAETGEVFCSTDNGNTFPAVTSPAQATLFGVVGAQNDAVIVFGVAGTCYRSTDAGNSWTAVNIATQDDLTAAYTLASGWIIMGTEADALFVSKDNGVSFNAMSGGPPISIFGIVQAADGAIIFVGDSNVARVPLAVLTS